jgi:uncharacterized protein YbbK (DUF523 family)/uncharacterized protein YbgA (DUF1722 family)
MPAADGDTARRIPVGISSCLLGEEVRYNGGHKRHRYIKEVLGRHFEFFPVCPEVAIGLGVPRTPIHLVGDPARPRAMVVGAGGRDLTVELRACGRRMARALSGISAYIFKSKSPSCGMEQVGIHDDRGMPSGLGRGIYAAEIMDAHPLLPVEEEDRLDDPERRDNFIARVHVFDRWRRLEQDGLTAAGLTAFHSEHEYLLMARDQQACRELARLPAALAEGDLADRAAEYIRRLMAALAQPATQRDRANGLMRMSACLKGSLDRGDRRELHDAIEAYCRDDLSLLVPLALLSQHLRCRHKNPLGGQRFLNPFPREIESGRH